MYPKSQYWAQYFSTSSLMVWMVGHSLNSFADDTEWREVADTPEGHASIQCDFDKLEKWAAGNLTEACTWGGYWELPGWKVTLQKKTWVSSSLWLTTGTGCEERLWSLLPQIYSSVIWKWSWTTCSRWLCLNQEAGPNDLQISLPISTILSFCENTT